jgi:hypothetical protein
MLFRISGKVTQSNYAIIVGLWLIIQCRNYKKIHWKNHGKKNLLTDIQLFYTALILKKINVGA